MISAILADDEPMIVKGLRKLIPWEEYGIRIVGEAWTGRGLLEQIDKEHPDLVVTDISMPDGSGIDVIKEIKRRQLRTKVIFISAYQEFSFAKDALAYGAVDYLVKPVEKILLASAVQKAVAELKEESEEITFKSKLAAYENRDKKVRLEELFDRLLDGDIRPAEAEKRLNLLEAAYRNEGYTALMFEPIQSEHDTRWGDHEKRLLLFAVSNLAEELLHRQGNGLVLRRGEKLCAVLNHREAAEAYSLAKDILDNTRLYLKMELAIGVGHTTVGLEQVRASYLSAADALRKAVFTESGMPVIGSQDVHPSGSGLDEELKEARQKVLQALLSKDERLADECAGRLLDLLDRFCEGNKDAAVAACFSSLREWYEELKGVGVAISGAEQQDCLASLQALSRFAQLRQFMRNQVQAMLRFMGESGSGKDAHQLQIVKDYIEQHYMENITLESMAALIFMNPYYFSSFFKKHTLMNFKQYLTEVRMKQAVRLLLQTDLMIYEVAERVGYNNARQFSDMFKKHFGKLPQEFKNQ